MNKLRMFVCSVAALVSTAVLAQDSTLEQVVPKAQPVVSESHPWKGVRVAYFGDSVTDPRNSGSKLKYWNFLEQWLGITPYVYARSGRQWNDIPNQMDKCLSEHGDSIDAILIFIGTNDFYHHVPIGKWFDEVNTAVDFAEGQPRATVERKMRKPVMDRNTYRGCINIALSKLKDAYPTKQIILLTPIHRAYFYAGEKNIQPSEAYQNGCGEYLDSYVESVKEAGNIWAVPVIDLNALSGLYPLAEAHAQYFKSSETDLLHPNDAGHRRIALTLLYQLQSLPCKFAPNT